MYFFYKKFFIINILFSNIHTTTEVDETTTIDELYVNIDSYHKDLQIVVEQIYQHIHEKKNNTNDDKLYRLETINKNLIKLIDNIINNLNLEDLNSIEKKILSHIQKKHIEYIEIYNHYIMKIMKLDGKYSVWEAILYPSNTLDLLKGELYLWEVFLNLLQYLLEHFSNYIKNSTLIYKFCKSSLKIEILKDNTEDALKENENIFSVWKTLFFVRDIFYFIGLFIALLAFYSVYIVVASIVASGFYVLCINVLRWIKTSIFIIYNQIS